MASVRIRMRSCVFSVLLLNIFCSFVSSLYFHIGETEKKCFIEEIPDETMIIGNYRMQLYDKRREEYTPATQGLGMFVEVKDPDYKVILSRQYGSEGRFTFTSHTPGVHRLCLYSTSSKFTLFAEGMLRVHLDIQVGERANNYTEIARQHRLTELQLELTRLTEEARHILRELEYQRYREKLFREVTHSTDTWILWWPIIRVVYVVSFIRVFTSSRSDELLWI
ncbi:transmembrane emp24 domain-containing protein 9-like [Parambassis ranga]|uniref:Transmembrane emp24 domain-containing protein 9-like n=1 Tax=Parambassis ranga TaxID=210632 RepID=A0A6P7J5A2_9TELE|nr:transmembrane emp24 domain-containing protein 9-like [Parambassis ranga]